jgi:hypothetical protein
VKGLRAKCALGARCPRQCLRCQMILDRRDDVSGKSFVIPPRVAEIPRFEMTVLKPPPLHGLDHPFACGLEVG